MRFLRRISGEGWLVLALLATLAAMTAAMLFLDVGF